MKIQAIKLGEQSFSTEDFNTSTFEMQVSERLKSLIDLNNADSIIIKNGIKLIKKLGEDFTLSPIEEFTLQCFKIRAKASIIIDGELDEGLEETLKNIGPEDMYDIIALCESREDIVSMLASIKEETQKKIDFKDACEIFKDIDYQNITREDFDLICGLLREFDLNGELVSLIENNPHRKIRILENKSYKAEQNIVFIVDEFSDSPYFYLEGQVYLKMKEITVDNPKKSGEKYYKGITFGKKKGILTTSGDIVANQVLDITHSINGVPVILVKDIYGGGHHIYLPEENRIIHMSAVIVGTYYEDKNNRKIDEDDEEFDEKISDPEVRKIMRLIIDAEKGLYYDFDGEDFGKLKIKTDNFILGRDAGNTLH